jgi:3-deoxy-D-manno-octulosonate 8-phosphate phosphatase KdsC-like HAD superfamily phosphatase
MACSPTATLYIGAQGEAFKAFNILDGHGVRMLQAGGVAAAILSGRSSEAVAQRAERALAIAYVDPGLTRQGRGFRAADRAPWAWRQKRAPSWATTFPTSR